MVCLQSAFKYNRVGKVAEPQNVVRKRSHVQIPVADQGPGPLGFQFVASDSKDYHLARLINVSEEESLELFWFAPGRAPVWP